MGAIDKLAQCMAEMENIVHQMPQLAGAWDFAAATAINWNPGKVERFYYEFYKGQEMIDHYPEEMQTAVREGGIDFLQGRTAEPDLLPDP